MLYIKFLQCPGCGCHGNPVSWVPLFLALFLCQSVTEHLGKEFIRPFHSHVVHASGVVPAGRNLENTALMKHHKHIQMHDSNFNNIKIIIFIIYKAQYPIMLKGLYNKIKSNTKISVTKPQLSYKPQNLLPLLW